METDELQSLLNTVVRVTITDGRRFVGLLRCTDRDCNLIMQDVVETSDTAERKINMLMVPGQHLQRMEINRNIIKTI